MGFAEAKDKTLDEILKSEPSSSWASTDFMKLVDAKIGHEVSHNLLAHIGAVIDLKNNIQQATSKLIRSNEELSKANNKYAKALCWLTGGLIFVGIIQVVAQIINP